MFEGGRRIGFGGRLPINRKTGSVSAPPKNLLAAIEQHKKEQEKQHQQQQQQQQRPLQQEAACSSSSSCRTLRPDSLVEPYVPLTEVSNSSSDTLSQHSNDKDSSSTSSSNIVKLSADQYRTGGIVAFLDDRIRDPETPQSAWAPLSVWDRWTNASVEKLAESEANLLRRVKAHLTSRFVPIDRWNSSIYTITAKLTSDSEESDIPFVLVHSFAAGVGIWAANLGPLSEKRTVHAFDILGFGRSSRPQFSHDPTLAELEFVLSIEDWRKAMNIERMILIGHSFGGYLASSYSLEYPQRVRHLVLVDPLGFNERPTTPHYNHYPIWLKAMGLLSSEMISPFGLLRMAGPRGPHVVRTLRSDLRGRFKSEIESSIFEYVYQCNAQNPTGERAFLSMIKYYGWPKRPMIRRFLGLDPALPVTFIYGGKSYMDTGTALDIQTQREFSYTEIMTITKAGHHVYADEAETFNYLVHRISDYVDLGKDIRNLNRYEPQSALIRASKRSMDSSGKDPPVAT